MGNKLQHGHMDADDGGALTTSAGIVPTGSILLYGGSAAPTGYLLCDGSAVSRTTYAALYAVIGTTYGAGDGSTTFNVPDARGRAPIGAGQGSGLTNRVPGATGGAETHTLTISEIPSHNHLVFCQVRALVDSGTNNLREPTPASSTHDVSSGNTGGGGSHNNMQPFWVPQFIIKT